MYEDIRPLQEKELIILKELKRICNKHGIPYYLSYGTLIGAVRHKGFIPWDDDIDTAMLYPDYERFEQICKTELNDVFFLQSRYTQPEAGLTYNKLRMNGTTLIIDSMRNKDINHGIDIDIQAIYNVPDNSVLRAVQLLNASIYMLLQVGEAPVNNGKLLHMISSVILFLIRGTVRTKIKESCYKNMAKYENIRTKYKAKLFGNLRICKTLYPAECFDSTIEVPFEDDSFSIPIGYDQILKRYYGEYMAMPPKENRGAKLCHIIKYDLENSYEMYKGKLYCVDKQRSDLQ